MSAVLERQPIVYQDYSLDRKAEVLALVKANNGNVLRTAQETGIHHATIQYWQANEDRFAQIQQQKQADLAQECEDDARYYFALARSKAPGAPYNHLMTGAAIATDKMQLLRGLPTAITESVERTDMTVILQSALSDTIDITPTDGSQD